MSDQQDAKASPPKQISFNVLVQYVKDLSFESPNAPKILATTPPAGGPQINIQVNVNARQIEPENFEVELAIETKATFGEEVMFVAEVLYAGIFRVTGLTGDELQAFVLIECPRLLFPFARQIIADATRNGGFPPLLIDPIDFVALYHRRKKDDGMGLVAGTA